jgi:hypothetical protein
MGFWEHWRWSRLFPSWHSFILMALLRNFTTNDERPSFKLDLVLGQSGAQAQGRVGAKALSRPISARRAHCSELAKRDNAIKPLQQPKNQPPPPNVMHPIAPRRRPFRPHFTYLLRLVLTRSRCPARQGKEMGVTWELVGLAMRQVAVTGSTTGEWRVLE